MKNGGGNNVRCWKTWLGIVVMALLIIATSLMILARPAKEISQQAFPFSGRASVSSCAFGPNDGGG